MATKKKGTKTAPARYYILNSVIHELAPGEQLPPALRPPKPKKRYTAAEQGIINAWRELQPELIKYKRKQKQKNV
ncbi:MAG: hypothetical protein HOP19_23860 [Acidobacteria bacterium]|nr:hypothetical protein [Acidobacteriota bacterium]